MTIRKWLTKLVLAGSLVLGLSAGASAEVPVFTIKEPVNHLPTTFSNAYSFEVSAPGMYELDLRHNGGPDVFENLALNVYSGSNTAGSFLGGINGEGRFSFSADTAGLYTALLFGEKAKLNGGGTVGISAVSVVPEIETWVMLLVGMGLIAYTLHRKKQPLGGPALSMA